MHTKRFILTLLVVLFALTSMVYIAFPQENTSQTPEASEEAEIVYHGDPDALQACGAYLDMVTLEAPPATTAMPTNTTDPNAATATPAAATSTPRPAPSVDNVGFPAGYESEFRLFFIFNRPDRKFLRIICGNDIAAQRLPGEEFAYGSVLLMISYSAKLDSSGQPVMDGNGRYIGQNLVAVHVQRKEEGFGEAYSTDRNGEWEYMAYNADGSVQVAPRNTNFCAACHGGEAGTEVDYVFRMNMLYNGDSALDLPALGENEIIIDLYSFHEPVLEVQVGTTVTWINNDEANHRVVAAVVNADGRVVVADAPLFDSDILISTNIEAGDSYSFTFTEPGEYLYRCSIHENMTARIIVTE